MRSLLIILCTACSTVLLGQTREIRGRFVAMLDGLPLGETGTVVVVDKAEGFASPVIVYAPTVNPGPGDAAWQDSNFQCVLFSGMTQEAETFDICVEYRGEETGPTSHVVAHVMRPMTGEFYVQPVGGNNRAIVSRIEVLSESLALYSGIFAVDLRNAGSADTTRHHLAGFIKDFPVPGAYNYRPQLDTSGCGLDITDALRTTLAALEVRFKQLTEAAKEDFCDCLNIGIDNPIGWVHAWDIRELSQSGAKAPPAVLRDVPACASEHTPACSTGVAIDKKYFRPNSVNYAIYGTMKRVCFDWEWIKEHRIGTYSDYLKALRLKRDMMNISIDAYKGPGPSLEGVRNLLHGQTPRPAPNWRYSREWADAAFDGWHYGNADAPQAEVECDAKPKPSLLTIFTVQWCEDYDFLAPLGW